MSSLSNLYFRKIRRKRKIFETSALFLFYVSIICIKKSAIGKTSIISKCYND